MVALCCMILLCFIAWPIFYAVATFANALHTLSPAAILCRSYRHNWGGGDISYRIPFLLLTLSCCSDCLLPLRSIYLYPICLTKSPPPELDYFLRVVLHCYRIPRSRQISLQSFRYDDLSLMVLQVQASL